MSAWNPQQYLKFLTQRTQPSRDLAERAAYIHPKTVLDIGCGPGNSTSVLRESFPNAALSGIDSSPAMIEKARKMYPALDFRAGDAREIQGEWDLLFSNACLQWIPDHEGLLPLLMEHVSAGGALAAQLPLNGEEPFYRILREVIAGGDWGFDGSEAEYNETLPPEAYWDILSGCTRTFDIWETVYYHPMPDCQAMIDWVSSARLRPYLSAMPLENRDEFLRAILVRAQEAYRPQRNGEILFRFRRLFFIGEK